MVTAPSTAVAAAAAALGISVNECDSVAALNIILTEVILIIYSLCVCVFGVLTLTAYWMNDPHGSLFIDIHYIMWMIAKTQ